MASYQDHIGLYDIVVAPQNQKLKLIGTQASGDSVSMKNNVVSPALDVTFSNDQQIGASPLRLKPSTSRINPLSQKIVEYLKRDGRYSPISMRANEIELQKQLKMERSRALKQQVLDKENMSYSFVPQINESVILLKLTGEKRTLDQFLSDMNNWEKNKVSKLNYLKEKQYQEQQSNLTFKPSIDENSLKIMSLDTKDTHQLRINKQVIQQEQVVNFPFKPKINKTSKQLAMRIQSDLPVQERLYRNEKREHSALKSDKRLPEVFGPSQLQQILEQSKQRKEYEQRWKLLEEVRYQDENQDEDKEPEIQSQEGQIEIIEENPFPYNEGILQIEDFQVTNRYINERAIDMQNYKFIHEILQVYDKSA